MGLCCDEGGILSLHYLPLKTAELPPQNMLAQEVAKQIKFYLNKPKHLFDLFLYPADTPHRRKVREAVSAVKSGGTATYLDIARKVGSSLALSAAPAVKIMFPCSFPAIALSPLAVWAVLWVATVSIAWI